MYSTSTNQKSNLSEITPEPRTVEHEYLDPLDTIWIGALQAMGIRLVYTPNSYAEYDGNGTLAIGTTRNLDPDDCVPQIVLHEICHWLIEGEESAKKINWGVINTCDRDLHREFACLRLQAALAQPYGLRKCLANTTDHRVYYDALPNDPLQCYGFESDTIALAQQGMKRSTQKPWGPALHKALATTQVIVAAASEHATAPSLYCLYDP